MRIGRPRLARRVREALSTGAAILTAPAGYGKTVLLEEALASWAPPIAWVRCTASDRDRGALAIRLIAAVGDAVPGTARRLAPLRGAVRKGIDPIWVTGELMAQLDRLPDPMAIVVDDAQYLAGRGGAGVVGALLRAASGAVGVAVASRRRLDIPLAKLRSGGRLAELGVGDLAFTSGELAELALTVSGAAPGADQVDELLLATEGWPLGAAVLVGRLGAAGAGEARSAALWSALAETVLAPLDRATRRGVLVSSVPPRLSRRVAAALGLPNEFLEDARAQGVPLRSESPDGGWLAYDSALRAVLLQRLAAEEGTGLVGDLRRRAAPALAAEGLQAEAIETWARAGEWDLVAARLADRGMFAAGSPPLVESWIESLPPVQRSLPAVAAVRGQLARVAGNWESAIALLGAATSSGRLAGDALVWARLALADALVTAGDLPAVVGVAKQLGNGGRNGDSPSLAPGVAPGACLEIIAQGYSDLPAGRLAAAERASIAAIHELERDDPVGLRFGLMDLLALTLAEQGRPEDALGWWRRIGVEAAECHLTGKASAACGFEAMVLAQLDRLDEAEAALAMHPPVPAWTAYPRHVARAVIGARLGRAAEVLAAADLALGCARGAPPAFRTWAAADVAPPLVTAGAPDRAAEVIAGAARLVGGSYPGARGRLLRARLGGLRAWLAAGLGADVAAAEEIQRALDDAGDAAVYLLRREWPRLAPVVSRALDLGLLDGTATVALLAAAFPDGIALVPFTGHPSTAVRIAALGPAVASGHPDAARRAMRLCRDPDPSLSAAARGALARAGANGPPREFKTLGGFAVRRGAYSIVERDWSRPIDARLVRFLLVREGVPAPEDVLFDALWPELSPASARRSLQVAASRVRAHLDYPGAGVSILEFAHGAYRLRRAPADVIDWEEFESAAAAALSGPSPARRALEHARSLWGGEPLPEERHSDWTTAWRERLNECYLQVLAAIVDHGQREGDHGAAIEAAREMVSFDPLNEAAHRELMAAYARAGHRNQALRQFLACSRTLAAEVGVEPAEHTVRLHGAILDGSRV